MSDREPSPTPLSPAERALLGTQPDEAAERVPFANRMIQNLEISKVHWQGKPFCASRFEHVTFTDCILEGVDFRDAELSHVTFLRCQLSYCILSKVRFSGCKFVGCTLLAGRSRAMVLRECTFEDSSVEALLIDAAKIEGLTQRAGKMTGVSLSESQIRDWKANGTRYSDVNLTLCEGGSMELLDCTVDEFGWLGGEFASLLLRGGTISNASATEVKCTELRLEGVRTLTRFHVRKSTMKRLVVSKGPGVTDLYVFETKVDELVLSHGRFFGWVTEGQVGRGSRVEEAELESFFWDETRATGLTFRQVRFVDSICARKAHFKNMRLEHVTYAPDIELVLTDATFEDSDRFAVGKPAQP